MRSDVIIVGGGVIGCAIAFKLASSGLKVTLIERGEIGCEASRAAAGMLSPQSEAEVTAAFFQLCLRSRLMYPDFVAALIELSGIDPEYRDEGALFVAISEQEQKELERWAKWQRGAGLEPEWIPADSLRKLEPAVTEWARGAYFIPGDHQVDNRRLMDALERAIKRMAVEVIEAVAVNGLMVERGKATGVICGAERLQAGTIVIASGCWSGQLLESAGIDLKLIPARGQMVAARGAQPLITRIAHSGSCYLVPRRDGRVLIGATVEYVGFRKAITVEGIAQLLTDAIRLVPSIASCEIVEAWSGLRPDTIDHLPVIGPSGISGLFIATGHFRNGILLAPVTAEAIAEMIINHRVPADIEPFGIQRLGPA
jgi:glycine oxidase